MSRSLRVVRLASTLSVALWCSPGFAAMLPAPSSATEELRALNRLDTALRVDLHIQEQRLDSACEFVGIRTRLIEVRDEAIAAAERLKTLWRGGRLRAGGLAMSEVLVRDFATLIDEARRDTALADTLATLEEETRKGSGDARALLRRMIEIHPAAPACLSDALDEPDRGDLPAVRVLERALSIDYMPERVLVIRPVR